MKQHPSGRSLAERSIWWAYLALLVWAPLPLGSNRPWSWAILELWVFLLALAWLALYAADRVAPSMTLRRAGPMLAGFALWVAYVWLQLVPLPIGLLELISPEAARRHLAAGWPIAPESAPLALDSYGALHGALKSSAYVAFFALSLALLDRSERIAAAAYALVLSGLAQALYGGLEALGAGIGNVAHGSFVNRNHFAGYLEMCLAAGLGLLIAQLSDERARTWRQFVRNALHWILSPKMRLRLALAIMVIALVLSRSRMGNSAFFASVLIAGAIALLLSKRASRSMVIVIATLIVIDIFIVGAYFGVEQVVQRIEQTDVATEERDDVAGDMLAMWRAFPVFGSGLGSFHIVFPAYRGPGVSVLYTHAHNDYLQFAVETGLLGAGLLGLLVAASAYAAIRAQFLRHDPLMRGISFAAMMGIAALLIHSWVDFNLQIPANALTFMLMLAFAWVSLHHGRASRHATGEEPPGAIMTGQEAGRPRSEPTQEGTP